MAYPFNDWNKLRMQQIFGQSQSPQMGNYQDYANPMEFETPTEIEDPLERYKQFQPQTRMQDLFASAAQSPPNRGDFRPGVMQRISAGLQSMGTPAGMWGGIPVGYKSRPDAAENRQQILNQPYNEAALDYKMRIDPLRAAADDERMANSVQSQFLDRTVNRDIQDRNLDRMIQRDIRTGGQKDTALEQANRRLGIYEKGEDARIWKTKNPNAIIKQDEEGFLIAIDPQRPNQATYVTDRNNERIIGSQLPDTQRIELTTGAAILRDAAQGAQSRQTKSTPPAAAPGRTTKRHEVVYDADGNPTGIRETTTESGPTQGGGSNQPPPNVQRNGNKVLMYAPNGQAAWIPIDKTDQAQADKFTFNDPRTGSDFRPPQKRPLGMENIR